MKSREKQYLLDILLAAEQAQSFVAGCPDDVLMENALIRAGVFYSLAVIGEAANRILKVDPVPELPNLPWHKMAGLRNVIIHEYEGVNLDRVWEVVHHELPVVIATLSPLFPERTR